eukprot:GEMP01016650.1.p1 GENE.GEMP01016650.1~~GEMP01016650.1.p1  ORF type:complete len:664 (+),score=123.65 GEMP01016650.1:205-2196(+)
MVFGRVFAVATLVFGKQCFWAHKKPEESKSPTPCRGSKECSDAYFCDGNVCVRNTFPKLYKVQGGGDWVDEDDKPNECDEAVEIYRHPHGGLNEGQCKLSDGVEVVGCFPWVAGNAALDEQFTNIPVFAKLPGKKQKLASPSADACERYCGNYKFFGLRQENNEIWCWCTSAEEMGRLDSIREDEKQSLVANFAVNCNVQCTGCSATTTYCGGKKHTLVYRRKPARNMIALDMSGSMDIEDLGAPQPTCVHGAHPSYANHCKSPFRIKWGKLVLNCVLENQDRLSVGTSVHRIAGDDSSNRLYNYDENFTNATIYNNPGWTANGGTYLWKYLYDQLKTEPQDSVNNGLLEVLLFTDGQDTRSEDFFYGKNGFTNMANELAKDHGLFPRFRIVCLNGREAGCEGYEHFAVTTGGSYANFDETSSDDTNEKTRQRFCGVATAKFTKPTTTPTIPTTGTTETTETTPTTGTTGITTESSTTTSTASGSSSTQVDGEGTKATGAQTPAEDEDESSNWLLPLLIAAGILLCCCLLCAFWCAKKKKKDNYAEQERIYAQEPVPLAFAMPSDQGTHNIAPTKYDDVANSANSDKKKRRKKSRKLFDVTEDDYPGMSPSKKKKKHRTNASRTLNSGGSGRVRKSRRHTSNLNEGKLTKSRKAGSMAEELRE